MRSLGICLAGILLVGCATTPEQSNIPPAPDYKALMQRIVAQDYGDVLDRFPGKAACLVSLETDNYTPEEMQQLDAYARAPTNENITQIRVIQRQREDRVGKAVLAAEAGKCALIRPAAMAFTGAQDLVIQETISANKYYFDEIGLPETDRQAYGACLWTVAEHGMTEAQIRALDLYARGQGSPIAYPGITWETEKEMHSYCSATLIKIDKLQKERFPEHWIMTWVRDGQYD